MQRQSKKRKQLIRRMLSYALMSTAVAVLLVVLVFIMLGYRYDRSDGRIEQGGLVQMDSIPEGAAVTINSVPFSSKTPTKSTLVSGSHAITMARSGYQAWYKMVNVKPGEVLWLSYARLVPAELPIEEVADFSKVSSTSVSPDEKVFAVQEKPETAQITLVNIEGDTVRTSTLALPQDSFTKPKKAKNQSFTLDSWSSDSRYLLVKHTYDGKHEWLVVDTRDADRTRNVTKLLDIDASKMVFSGNNSQILYARIGADLRKIDLGAATMSRPLVARVADFSLFEDTTIVYTTTLNDDGERTVGYYHDGDEKVRTVRTYKDNGKKPLRFAMGRYLGTQYQAIAYGETVTVLRGDPAKPSELREVASFDMKDDTDYLSIKTKGRFVVAQSGASYSVYDVELQKQSSTTLQGTAKVNKPLQWLDGYMPWSDRNGNLRLYEFDGANQHDIMPVASGFDAAFSPNDKYLYGIQKTKDGTYHLSRVKMILS